MNTLKMKRVGDHYLEMPVRATPMSAGIDLRAATFQQIVILPGDRKVIPTGWAMQIDPGWCGLILPRSGWAVNHGIDKMAGLIDADYRGEVKVVLVNHDLTNIMRIDHGDRIAQMVFLPVAMVNCIEVEELDDTDRGDGGFGHTGVS